ncbi:NADH-quinone oxidoreductase subunit N [Dysgonomonas macrotermitis]|uniref:NADH-quinone oxidoreductase subunit N n=1 Tax=Dysgonomonas macrotermitis TaxID=1346286 RepID=A0A1M5G338_9BACT|nr:NADH-quinone oxidoreductase subunit N [Dysgonomonas macrotermitis]SHF98148.1 NADH dehydrogenase subunit N [Dysgonomonas macrotermitis]
MSTLVAVSALGIICLLLEVLNLRKILVPITLLGLAGILGMTIAEFYLNTSFLDIDTYKMVVSTGYSRGFSSLFIILTMLVLMMSPKFYAERIDKIADYVALIIFMLAGAIAMVSFSNLSMFFIGVEVLSIPAYILAASNPKDKMSNEAGMKYFIMGAFASSFILFGIALVYGAIGSFDIETIIAISMAQGEALPVWFKIGFVMIAVGLFFKAGVVPFHFWAPDVYEGSPTLVTALMSTLVKVAALGALYKVFVIFAVGMTPAFQIVVVILTILTLSVGNITALRQRNLKRLMAYSGISHAGFMMMDLLSNGAGTNVILYYAAAYSLAGIAAFAVIMAVCGDKDEDISNIFGLAKEKSYLAGLFTCAMVSLGGIPIFAGFFAKLFMFTQMIESGYLILVIFGVINSIIAIYYYFGTANVMFSKDSVRTQALKVDARYVIVASIAITLNIILGLFPSVIMGLTI